MDDLVSVIVPCHNAASYLGDQLSSLAAQNGAVNFEVIVVDNLSTDGTVAVARSFSQDLNLRIAEARDATNPSYARNVGASTATGSLLLFVDADDVLGPGYVGAMTEALAEADFVSSRVDSDSLNPSWVVPAYGRWQESGLDDFFGFLPCTGPNVGLTRHAFEKVGGWPEEYPYGCEDIVLSWRLQLLGYAPMFVPDALYLYRHRQRLRDLFLQNLMTSHTLPRLYREFRSQGMKRRSVSTAAGEWLRLVTAVFRLRTRTDVAQWLVRIAYAQGRILGSFRYRTLFV